MNSFTSALSSGESPSISQYDGIILKGLGIYQVACIPVDITHKNVLKGVLRVK